MRGTQKAVGAVVTLLLVLGGYGCRYALREATDDAADKIAQDAVDDAYDWGPDTTEGDDTPRTTAATTAPATTTPATTAPATTAPAEDPNALPKGWPASLVLVEGLVVQSTSDLTGPTVVGNVKGDVIAVTEAIRTDLAEAGFTVDPVTSTPPGVGGSVTQSAGPAGSVSVLMSPTPEDPGTLIVTYRVTPA